MNISVVIIVKNGAKTIRDTLDSLYTFNDVVVYDNGSIDETETICRTYANVHFVKGVFSGFGPTKNSAARYAKYDWVLSLDSDEIVLPQLIEEIKDLNLKETKYVFRIKRDNYFLEKEIKYSGWGQDRLIRLYHRTSHQFNENKVHEFVALHSDTIVIDMKHSFKHNAVQNVNQFLQKVMKYSDLASQDKKSCFFLIVVFKALFAFFRTYVLQWGFLDGWRGVVIAISNFNGTFFRYTKRYINCKHLKR